MGGARVFSPHRRVFALLSLDQGPQPRPLPAPPPHQLVPGGRLHTAAHGVRRVKQVLLAHHCSTQEEGLSSQ